MSFIPSPVLKKLYRPPVCKVFLSTGDKKNTVEYVQLISFPFLTLFNSGKDAKKNKRYIGAKTPLVPMLLRGNESNCLRLQDVPA